MKSKCGMHSLCKSLGCFLWRQSWFRDKKCFVFCIHVTKTSCLFQRFSPFSWTKTASFDLPIPLPFVDNWGQVQQAGLESGATPQRPLRKPSDPPATDGKIRSAKNCACLWILVFMLHPGQFWKQEKLSWGFCLSEIQSNWHITEKCGKGGKGITKPHTFACNPGRNSDQKQQGSQSSLPDLSWALLPCVI